MYFQVLHIIPRGNGESDNNNLHPVNLAALFTCSESIHFAVCVLFFKWLFNFLFAITDLYSFYKQILKRYQDLK